MNKNGTLHRAKRGKYDEFYTQLSDIENELRHYKRHFRGKTVYCNCDDPRVSNFWQYFALNFQRLGLKKLVTTCYKNQSADLFSRHDSERAVVLEYEGYRDGENVPRPEDIGLTHLKGDGDFRSRECIEILKKADIVVTNPPFSLFREYVAQLVEQDKKFLIIGHQNAITYKEIFPLIRNNRLWLGRGFRGGATHFVSPYTDYATAADHREGMIRVSGVMWFTNLDHAKRHEDLILYKRYTPDEYPQYDNYDAINVNRTADIPEDYDGAMGVPITFLDKHNPDQFEIVGVSYLWDEGLSSHTFYDDWVEMRPDGSRTGMKGSKANGLAVLKGRPPNPRGYYLARGDDVVHTVYKRLFIRRKKGEHERDQRIG